MFTEFRKYEFHELQGKTLSRKLINFGNNNQSQIDISRTPGYTIFENPKNIFLSYTYLILL